MATLSPSIKPKAAPSLRKRMNLDHLGNWIFLNPALFFFIGYMVYPILRVLWMSFTDYRYLSQEPAQWVGLQNYIDAFADPLVEQMQPTQAWGSEFVDVGGLGHINADSNLRDWPQGQSLLRKLMLGRPV